MRFDKHWEITNQFASFDLWKTFIESSLQSFELDLSVTHDFCFKENQSFFLAILKKENAQEELLCSASQPESWTTELKLALNRLAWKHLKK